MVDGKRRICTALQPLEAGTAGTDICYIHWRPTCSRVNEGLDYGVEEHFRFVGGVLRVVRWKLRVVFIWWRVDRRRLI